MPAEAALNDIATLKRWIREEQAQEEPDQALIEKWTADLAQVHAASEADPA